MQHAPALQSYPDASTFKIVSAFCNQHLFQVELSVHCAQTPPKSELLGLPKKTLIFQLFFPAPKSTISQIFTKFGFSKIHIFFSKSHWYDARQLFFREKIYHTFFSKQVKVYF